MKILKFILVNLYLLAGLTAGYVVTVTPGIEWYSPILVFTFSEIIFRPALYQWMAFADKFDIKKEG